MLTLCSITAALWAVPTVFAELISLAGSALAATARHVLFGRSLPAQGAFGLGGADIAVDIIKRSCTNNMQLSTQWRGQNPVAGITAPLARSGCIP